MLRLRHLNISSISFMKFPPFKIFNCLWRLYRRVLAHTHSHTYFLFSLLLVFAWWIRNYVDKAVKYVHRRLSGAHRSIRDMLTFTTSCVKTLFLDCLNKSVFLSSRFARPSSNDSAPSAQLRLWDVRRFKKTPWIWGVFFYFGGAPPLQPNLRYYSWFRHNAGC